MELPDELVGIEEELDIEEEPALGLDEAESDAPEEDDEEREQFVRFSLGEAEYALHVNAVRRLVDVGERTRVPRSSRAIDGVTDLRGEITAVIDPRVLFQLPASERPTGTQELVVFATGPGQGSAGIRVDTVVGVEPIPVSRVVLEPADVGTDREVVEDLLDDALVAGLLREDAEEGAYDHVPVVDVEAVLDASRTATV